MKGSLAERRANFNQTVLVTRSVSTHLDDSTTTWENGRPVKHLLQWPPCPLLANLGISLDFSVMVEVAREDMIKTTWPSIPVWATRRRRLLH